MTIRRGVMWLKGLGIYGVGAARLPNGSPLMILGAGRSGTQLLVELLDSHPQLRCHGEVFSVKRRYPLAYVNGKATLARFRGYRGWGFKLLFDQLREFESIFGSGSGPLFLRRLHDRGFTLVVLERRNRLLQALSYIQAEKAGWWHPRNADNHRHHQLPVDPADVVATLETIDTDAKYVREPSATSLASSSGTRTTSPRLNSRRRRPSGCSRRSASPRTHSRPRWCKSLPTARASGSATTTTLPPGSPKRASRGFSTSERRRDARR